MFDPFPVAGQGAEKRCGCIDVDPVIAAGLHRFGESGQVQKDIDVLELSLKTFLVPVVDPAAFDFVALKKRSVRLPAGKGNELE